METEEIKEETAEVTEGVTEEVVEEVVNVTTPDVPEEEKEEDDDVDLESLETESEFKKYARLNERRSKAWQKKYEDTNTLLEQSRKEITTLKRSSTQRLNDLETKYAEALNELELLQGERKAEKLSVAKSEAITKFGLPEDALEFIKAETPEELIEQAEKLSQVFKASKLTVKTQGNNDIDTPISIKPQLAPVMSTAEREKIAREQLYNSF